MVVSELDASVSGRYRFKRTKCGVYHVKVVKRGVAAQKVNMVSIQGQPTTATAITDCLKVQINKNLLILILSHLIMPHANHRITEYSELEGTHNTVFLKYFPLFSVCLPKSCISIMTQQIKQS